jgi:hypothetical protein
VINHTATAVTAAEIEVEIEELVVAAANCFGTFGSVSSIAALPQ